MRQKRFFYTAGRTAFLFLRMKIFRLVLEANLFQQIVLQGLIAKNADYRKAKRNQPKPAELQVEDDIHNIANGGNKKQNKDHVQPNRQGIVQLLSRSGGKLLTSLSTVLNAGVILNHNTQHLQQARDQNQGAKCFAHVQSLHYQIMPKGVGIKQRFLGKIFL